MLSDEEKQAIDKLKRSANYFVMPMYETKIILELIEKQSKEIEDHIENKELINQTLGLEKNANINKTLERIIILNNYEDKIKAKIEELENEHTGCTTNVFSVLQSLLEKE